MGENAADSRVFSFRSPGSVRESNPRFGNHALRIRANAYRTYLSVMIGIDFSDEFGTIAVLTAEVGTARRAEGPMAAFRPTLSVK